MPGLITTAEADWWVDPVSGTATGAGTQNDPLDSVFRFDEDEGNSLSAGDNVALVNSGVDTLPSAMALSFLGNTGSQAITFGTWENNDGDYIIDLSSTSQNATGIYQFQCENVDWRGVEESMITIRGAKNHAMKQESASGQTAEGGTHEWMRFEDYGNDSTSEGGNGIWIARGVNGGVMRDCEFFDGSEPADSDGVYFGGPAGNRPGGWRFVRCESSYNSDDGFDFFRSDPNNPVVLVDCIAHHNGRDKEAWDSGDETGSVGAWGDGNGFKMAGDAGGNSWCYRCFAYKNKGRLMGGSGEPNGSGFDDNGQPNQRYLNCTSWDNEEWGFRCATGDTLIINSIAYQNGDGFEDGAATTVNNSFDLGGVTITDADFKSTTEGNTGFFVPAADSEIVDAGVVIDGYTVTAGPYSSYTIDLGTDPPVAITETFDGTAPDLGYIEETGTAGGSDGSSSGSGYGDDNVGYTGFGDNSTPSRIGGSVHDSLGSAVFDSNGAQRFN